LKEDKKRYFQGVLFGNFYKKKGKKRMKGEKKEGKGGK